MTLFPLFLYLVLSFSFYFSCCCFVATVLPSSTQRLFYLQSIIIIISHLVDQIQSITTVKLSIDRNLTMLLLLLQFFSLSLSRKVINETFFCLAQSMPTHLFTFFAIILVRHIKGNPICATFRLRM